MTIQLYQGDCLEVMRGFEPDCIDLTVTSPPYDNLRDYKGYTFDFEPIARELYRVTKPGGVVVWVVGDATIHGSETGTSFRHALYFMACGFNLHDTMIYKKVSGATGSNYSYWQAFDYIFVLSKGKPKTINLLSDRKNVNAPSVYHGTVGHRKRNGDRKGKVLRNDKEYGRRLNIWEYHTSDITEYTEHPAQFPEALARDHILSWSNPGDLVMDCFLGSGTTGKMAVMYQRNFIGIEISPEYLNGIAKPRIEQAQAQLSLFTEAQP